MVYGVFQQIQDDLFHQGGIHRGGQDFPWPDHGNGQGIGVTAQLHYCTINDFLHHFIVAVQAYPFPGHAGDGKHIFGNAGQPAGLPANLLQQGTALLFGKIGLFQK